MPENTQTTLASMVKVSVIERNMKAYLLIKELSSEQSQFITPEDVLNIINKEGVKYGMNQDVIREIIDGKKWGEKFLLAEGTPPAPGEDAKLEFYFPTDHSLRPQIKEDGHVDYKEISDIKSVDKDTLLIRKIAATLGPEGTDVLGNKISAVYGKDINPVLGQGVYKDPADNLLIKSSVEGIIFYNPQSNSIEVQKLYLVQGSVDYSTGNINVKSSVEIKGDVKPDFSITTPYNILVNGVVEQATITCGGTLTVRVGIKGEGKQLVKVNGDIHAGYINNQIVKCRGSIYAGTEIRNSVIESAEEIVLVKGGGVIIGGKITATKKINAPTIGNLYNIPTELEVGVNFDFREKFLEKEAAMKLVHKLMDDLSKKISLIEEEPPDGVKGSSIVSLKSQKVEYGKELERLRHELKEIEKDYYNVEDPIVCIGRKVYPGTIIKIKHATLEIKEELPKVTFSLTGNEITYK